MTINSFFLRYREYPDSDRARSRHELGCDRISTMTHTGTRSIALLCLMCSAACIVSAQQPTQPAATPTAVPAAIPVAEIPGRTEQTSELVRQLTAKASVAADITEIRHRFAGLEESVVDLAEETDRHTRTGVSRNQLEDSLSRWQRLSRHLDDLIDELSTRAAKLERYLANLDSEVNVWELTRTAARDEELPRSVREAVASSLRDLADARRKLADARDPVLTLQTEAASRRNQAAEETTAIREQIDRHRGSTFAFDRPPLWAAIREHERAAPLLASMLEAHRDNIRAVRRYAAEEGPRVALQAVVFVALLALALVLRRQTRQWAHEDESLRTTLAMLQRPLSTALLLAVITTNLIHPAAPMAWLRLLLMILLLAMLRLLPRVMAPRLRPGIYLLVVLFLLDRVLFLVPENHIAYRFALLALSTVGAGFLLWLAANLGDDHPPRRADWLRAIVRGCRIGAVLQAVAVAANVLGAVTLAATLTEGVLKSAWAAILLWAGAVVLKGMVILALHTPTAERLNMVRDRAETIRRTTGAGITFLALTWWAAVTLDGFGLLGWAFASINRILKVRLEVGEFGIAPLDVLVFALAVWISFKVSKLFRFVLEEDVLPRVELPRGVAGAVSKGTHYVVLLIGFLIAAAMAGVELGKVALVAGALGVGIGFGLQNIVNNFVSGLILLFERPIQVGDTIQLGTLGGTVKEIGMRASIVRTWEGAEVIVPNANLISNELVNWTLSDVTRRLDVRVGVAYGTDPESVLELLLHTAHDHPEVLAEPEPTALFLGFGDSSLDFELRAWTAESFIRVASELRVAVNRALREAGIQIPFPQRDVHIRSDSSGAERALTPSDEGADGT